MPLDSAKEKKEPEKKPDGPYSASQFAQDLMRSAAYSAIAAPTEGALQIADRVGGTNWQARSRDAFASMGVAAPQADATGAKWVAQTIGQAGMAVPLMLLHKPVKAMLADRAGMAVLTERTTLGLTVRESVATGFLQGSLLTATDDKKGLLASRIDSGFSSAVQFVGMTAAGYGLNRAAETGLAFKYGLNRVLTNPLATGVISGIPGGALTAEIEAVKQGRKLPTAHELGESMLSMSLVGGLFGGKHLLAEKLTLKPSLNVNSESRLLSHPDVVSVMRAPGSESSGPAFLDKLPGMDVTQPSPTGPWRSENGVRVAPWLLGEMAKENGGVFVGDTASGVNRFYSGGRLISSASADASVDAAHTYAYSPDGQLRAIVTGPNQGWFKTRGGWSMGSIDAETGRLSLQRSTAESARLTSEGVMFSAGDTAWSLPVAGRFVAVDAKGAVLTHRDMLKEQKVADSLVSQFDARNTRNGTSKFVAEDGRPLTLSGELKAFRAAASDHGLVNGYGQLEGEVNRSLAGGNEAEALGLLVAAQKLLPKEGVRSLSVVRNTEGIASVFAEGYVDGAHMRYLLDGTTIRTGPMMRTTTYPDGAKLEESFGSDDARTTRYNKSGGMEEIKFQSGSGGLVEKIGYGADSKINSVSFSQGDVSTSLTQVDGNWRLVQETQSSGKHTTENIITLGPGEVDLHVDGAAVFRGPNNHAYIWPHEGEVSMRFNGETRSATPGQPARILGLDSDTVDSRHKELAAKIAPELQGEFGVAGDALTSQMERLRVHKDAAAIIIGQVNHMLDLQQPRGAIALEKAVTEVLGGFQSDPGRLSYQTLGARVDRTPELSTLYLGNKAIDFAADGTVSIRRGAPLRFDGVTSAKFQEAVKQAVSEDINPAVAKLLEANGIAIIAGPTAAKVAPAQAAAKPAGWPRGSDNAASGAFYDASSKVIAVGERQNAYVRDGTVVQPVENPRLELLRAVGQAVDSITGLSQSGKFKQAFQTDEMDLKEPEKVAFYRNSSEKENFHVTFVDLFTGTQSANPQATFLRTKFPTTARLVDESIARLNSEEQGGARVEKASAKTEAATRSAAEAGAVADGYPLEGSGFLEEQPHLKNKISRATGRVEVLPEYIRQHLADDGAIERRDHVQAILAKQAPAPEHLTVFEMDDGTTVLLDSHASTRRTYDEQGRLIKATSTNGGSLQRYIYDDAGLLKAAFENNSGYLHNANGWQRIRVNEAESRIKISSTNVKDISVHPDGGLIIGFGDEWNSRMADGRHSSYSTAKVELDSANLGREQANLERVLARANAGDASGAREAALRGQIEVLRGRLPRADISDGQQGSALAELAHMVEQNPDRALKTLTAINSLMENNKVWGIWSEQFPDGSSAIRMTGPSAGYRYFSDGRIETESGNSYGTDTTMYGESGEKISQTFTPSDLVNRSVVAGESGLQSISEETKYSGTYRIFKQGDDVVRVAKGADGKEGTLNLGAGSLSIAGDNSIVFTPTDPSRPRMVHSLIGEDKLLYADGRSERIMVNGRRDFISADQAHESTILRTKMRSAFSDVENSQGRIERFEKMLAEYENRPAENDAARNKKALVLLQLNRLMAGPESDVKAGSSDPGSLFTRSQRADLAEQLLAQALDPIKIWQGGHQTCNVTTVQHRLMVQAPQRLIAMVADAVNEGGYTLTDGRRLSTSNLAEMFKPDTNAAANLAKQANPGNSVSHDAGERDWAGQIAQTVLIRGALLDKDIYISGNRILPDNSVAYVKEPQSGKYKPVFIDPAQLKPLDPRDTSSRTIYLPSQNILGMLPEKYFTPLRDSKGQWLDGLQAGETAYGGNGRVLLRRPATEELAFGRTPLSEDALISVAGQRQQYLIEPNYQLVDSPQMTVPDIERAYKNVDVDTSLGANIVGFNGGSSAKNVANEFELSQLMALQAEKSQLPAILLVHTRSQAFGHWHNGGLHVVNLYEPVDGGSRMRLSNQWGSASDYMGGGISTSILFSAMKAPSLAPAMPNIIVPVPRPGQRSTAGISQGGRRMGSLFGSDSSSSSGSSSGSGSESSSGFGSSFGSGFVSGPYRWFKAQGWLNFLNSRNS